MHVTTAVTCPTVRIHPAVIAQAAATSRVLLDGRFTLGVGSGEALNEHILGDRWPEADVRLEMLEEAIEVMRALWQGGQCSTAARHYTVENARIYTLPDPPPPIFVSGFGPEGDRPGGAHRRRLLHLSRTRSSSTASAPTAATEAGPGRARRSAGARRGGGRQDGPPALAERGAARRAGPGPADAGHFEQATELVTEEMIAESVPCGPDIDAHRRALQEFADAGFDELFVQQIGARHEEFFAVYAREVLPRF